MFYLQHVDTSWLKHEQTLLKWIFRVPLQIVVTEQITTNMIKVDIKCFVCKL